MAKSCAGAVQGAVQSAVKRSGKGAVQGAVKAAEAACVSDACLGKVLCRVLQAAVGVLRLLLTAGEVWQRWRRVRSRLGVWCGCSEAVNSCSQCSGAGEGAVQMWECGGEVLCRVLCRRLSRMWRGLAKVLSRMQAAVGVRWRGLAKVLCRVLCRRVRW